MLWPDLDSKCTLTIILKSFFWKCYFKKDQQMTKKHANMPSHQVFMLGHIIQLMHSFEVNISICQAENSDVHRGKSELNITFEGWLILMLAEKECTNWFVIWHCMSPFPKFISPYIFVNLLKSDIPIARKTRLLQQLLFKFLKLLWDVQKNRKS